MSDEFLEQLAIFRNEFLLDLAENIGQIEERIVTLEKSPNDSATKLELLRQIHSIKGSAGSFGLHRISTVCHLFEDSLEGPSELNISHLFEELDHIRGYLEVHLRQDLSEDQKLKELARFDQWIESEQHGNRSLRILVVDNTRTTASFVRSICQDCAIVTHVNDGMDALNRLVREKFDVLITGMEIQTITGVELLAAYSQLRRNENTKLILLSSSDKVHDRLEGMDYSHLRRSGALLDDLKALLFDGKAAEKAC